MLYLLLILSCTEQDTEQEISGPEVQISTEEMNEAREIANNLFGVIPSAMPGSENDSKEMIDLGKKLFFETRLSVNNTQSCNSCHRLDDGYMGVDNEVTSVGALGKRVHRNSPTVINAGFHISQFWDGRAPDLKEQAKGPILAKGEMEMPSQEKVLEVINSDQDYVKSFTDIYGENGITYDNLANSIAAFERTLITSDKFDEFQSGKKDLSKDELDGMRLFISSGCAGCHNGPLMGGQMYQKFGIFEKYSPDEIDHEDLGRFHVTEQEMDKFVFKVPSLRNVTKTGPYFHDGRSATIENAIDTMGRLQLNKELSDEEISKIKEFLHTLEGTLKE